MSIRKWLVGSIFMVAMTAIPGARGEDAVMAATNAAPAAVAPPVDPSTTHEARLAARQAAEAEATAPPPAGVTVQRDIAYVPGGGKSQMLDLFIPEQASNSMPLMIFIHGGGWRSGSKEGCPAKFLAQKGYVVASVNYRLSKEAAFPANIEDCRAALRFLRAHATEYHIQPDQVAVWGGSAGGHLAALMGTAAAVDFSGGPAAPKIVGKVDESIRVQCVIDMYGASDFTLLLADPGQMAHGVGQAASQNIGPTTSPEELAAKMKWSSPITYISKDTPPFLIQHGDADQTMPLEQAKVFAEALQKAGVEETLTIIPGAGHAGAGFFTEENHQAVLEFLDKHLKSPK